MEPHDHPAGQPVDPRVVGAALLAAAAPTVVLLAASALAGGLRIEGAGTLLVTALVVAAGAGAAHLAGAYRVQLGALAGVGPALGSLWGVPAWATIPVLALTVGAGAVTGWLVEREATEPPREVRAGPRVLAGAVVLALVASTAWVTAGPEVVPAGTEEATEPLTGGADGSAGSGEVLSRSTVDEAFSSGVLQRNSCPAEREPTGDEVQVALEVVAGAAGSPLEVEVTVAGSAPGSSVYRVFVEAWPAGEPGEVYAAQLASGRWEGELDRHEAGPWLGVRCAGGGETFAAAEPGAWVARALVIGEGGVWGSRAVGFELPA